MPSFVARLHESVRRKRTPALVGLDPRYELLPEPVLAAAARRQEPDKYSTIAAAYEEFCMRLIDVVAPLVPAVKPQAASFFLPLQIAAVAIQTEQHTLADDE